MTRIGFWIRLAGAFVLFSGSIGLAVTLGLTAGTSNRPVDHGIVSAIGFVSNDPVDGFIAEAFLLNVSPEEGTQPRLSVGLRGGQVAADEGLTGEGRYPAERSMVDDEEENVGGFSVVLGGRLADALGACFSETDITVTHRALSYAQLSEAERNAVVENIRAQEKDRSVAYGDRAWDAVAVRSAAEAATAMRYTVVDVTFLEPDTWKMDAPPVEEGKGADGSTEQVQDAELSYAGVSAEYQCDLEQALVFSDQPWGRRFDFPPITAYAETNAGTPAHVRTEREVARVRGNPHYSYFSAVSYGYQESSEEETSGGIYRVKDTEDAWTDGANSVAWVSEGQLAVAFQSFSSTQNRDLSIFAAGAAVSLAASLLIAMLKTVAGKRHYLPRWLGGKQISGGSA